jgi:NADH dehydrogenase (ubiquinone) 1 alpha/beta subcomplex 1
MHHHGFTFSFSKPLVSTPTPICKMICAALLRSSRQVPQALLRAPSQVARVAYPATRVAASRFSRSQRPSGLRFYSAHAGLAQPEVEGRILDILKNFDKVSFRT